MNILQNERILGIPDGIYYGQFDRQDELNTRTFEHTVYSNSHLQPNITPRSVATKYSLFPVIDRRTPAKVPVHSYPPYSTTTNFSTLNARAPPNGYMSSVNIESDLRNQYYALQHGADEGVYVPTSQSELYNVRVPVSTNRTEPQPFPRLWEKPKYMTRQNEMVEQGLVGGDKFFNHTRTQCRDLDE
jgi:hypothetical protein